MKMLEYTEVKISDLAFNKNNPRINDDAAEKLTKGIEKYGFINPVVVNRQGNMILAGHTRVKALKKLGKKTVPVLFVDMDEATARGFAIWDNKSAEFSEWDKDLLDLEIQELVDLDFDIELTGFSLDDLGLGDPGPGSEPGQRDQISENFMVVIECETEEEQLSLLEKFQEEGLKCKALIS